METKVLDGIMAKWATALRDDLQIGAPESNQLATTIASEVESLDPMTKRDLVLASPISVAERLKQLDILTLWLEESAKQESGSELDAWGHIVATNYITFVYLKDACFEKLARLAPDRSVTKGCCLFLTRDPVRSFRNAYAHGNWCASYDRTRIVYWDYEGHDRNKPLARHEVKDNDLRFWTTLAITTAFAGFATL